MKNELFILWMSILCSTLSQAQNRVGNGGNVVLCARGAAMSANLSQTQLLDFYESEKPLIHASESDPYKILESRIEVLSKKDSQLGERYRSRLLRLKTEISIKEDIDLAEIPDSNHLFRPADKNCQVKQAAVRRNLNLPNQSKFLVDKRIWDQLTPMNQAGLIMHEMVYEHFYLLGEQDSTKARVMTAYLFSKKFSEASSDGLWDTIRGLKVPIYRR